VEDSIQLLQPNSHQAVATTSQTTAMVEEDQGLDPDQGIETTDVGADLTLQAMATTIEGEMTEAPQEEGEETIEDTLQGTEETTDMVVEGETDRQVARIG